MPPSVVELGGDEAARERSLDSTVATSGMAGVVDVPQSGRVAFSVDLHRRHVGAELADVEEYLLAALAVVLSGAELGVVVEVDEANRLPLRELVDELTPASLLLLRHHGDGDAMGIEVAYLAAYLPDEVVFAFHAWKSFHLLLQGITNEGALGFDPVRMPGMLPLPNPMLGRREPSV